MPQGGSPQRSNGLIEKEGPSVILIDRVENTLSDGQKNAKIARKIPQRSRGPSGTELFARAWPVDTVDLPPPNTYLRTSFYA